MRIIPILVYLLFIPLTVYGQFSSSTTEQIDTIKNNNAVDITLDPVSSVKVNNHVGGFALQSGSLKELEESTVTSTELGYVSGVTSALQGQIDGKQDSLPLSTNGDLLFYNAGFAALPIGTAGQVLTVNGSLLPEWQDVIAVSVTTKGDVQTHNGTNPDRLAVGSNGQLLSANSATLTGLEWIDPPLSSPTTTIGDLIYNNTGTGSGDTRLPIGSETEVLTVISGIPSWEPAPEGGLNYFTNSGIELNATGFNAFDDGSFPPVDGTGGSPTVTVARSTTSGTYTPIRETASLLFTKPSGADYTGEGFSTDISVDKGFQGNMATGSVWVLANDNDCVDDAVKITIYDITNTTMERSVSNEGIKCNSLPYIHYFQFPTTSNSTEYRVAFTYDSTDTNEVLYYFDDFKVGQTNIAKGAYQRSELVDLTGQGSFTGGTIRVNRVGDIVTVSNIGTATFASTSNPDAAAVIPEWARPKDRVTTMYTGSSSTNYLILIDETGALDLVFRNWSGSLVNLTSSGDFTISYTVDDSLSNIALSSDLGAQEVAERYTHVSQTITASTRTTLIYDTPDSNNKTSHYDIATGIFTAPETGWYDIDATVTYPALNVSGGGDQAQIEIQVDDVLKKVVAEEFEAANSAKRYAAHLSDSYYLVRGQELKISTFQASDDASEATSSVSYDNTLSIAKRASGQTILDDSYEECQTKVLSADITTNTDPIADLTFNNLSVGRCYQVIQNALFDLDVVDTAMVFDTVNGSTRVARTLIGQDSTAREEFKNSTVEIFKAEATTLTSLLGSIGAGNVLRGNNSNETTLTLCELPASTKCESTKFD